MYMCINKFMCVYIYIFMYMHINKLMCVHVYVYECVYVYTGSRSGGGS